MNSPKRSSQPQGDLHGEDFTFCALSHWHNPPTFCTWMSPFSACLEMSRPACFYPSQHLPNNFQSLDLRQQCGTAVKIGAELPLPPLKRARRGGAGREEPKGSEAPSRSTALPRPAPHGLTETWHG